VVCDLSAEVVTPCENLTSRIACWQSDMAQERSPKLPTSAKKCDRFHAIFQALLRRFMLRQCTLPVELSIEKYPSGIASKPAVTVMRTYRMGATSFLDIETMPGTILRF